MPNKGLAVLLADDAILRTKMLSAQFWLGRVQAIVFGGVECVPISNRLIGDSVAPPYFQDKSKAPLIENLWLSDVLCS